MNCEKDNHGVAFRSAANKCWFFFFFKWWSYYVRWPTKFHVAIVESFLQFFLKFHSMKFSNPKTRMLEIDKVKYEIWNIFPCTNCYSFKLLTCRWRSSVSIFSNSWLKLKQALGINLVNEMSHVIPL